MDQGVQADDGDFRLVEPGKNFSVRRFNNLTFQWNRAFRVMTVRSKTRRGELGLDSLITGLCVHSPRQSGDRLRRARARESCPPCRMNVSRRCAVRIVAEMSRARGYRFAVRH